MGSSSSKSNTVNGVQRNRYPSQYNTPANVENAASIRIYPSSSPGGQIRTTSAPTSDYVYQSLREQLQQAGRGSVNITSGQSSLQSAFANTASARPHGQTRLSTAPTLEQLEETEIARAIVLSLSANNNINRTSNVSSSMVLPSNRTNNTVSLSQNRTINTASLSQNRTINTAPLSQNRTINTVNVGKTNTADDSASKREMAFDCSICMELNEEEAIVATECGHLFHNGCVSPWIQQAGTCPSCRVRITIASLRKIFVSVSSSGNASTSNTTDLRSINNVNNKSKNNGGKNFTKNDSNNRNNDTRIIRNRRTPVTSLPTFNRSIWLGSQDKQMTEQSLTSMIAQRFNLTSQKFSVRSLKKRGAPQPHQRYVSFKISVDTEITFNSLIVSTMWPVTFRVREFIERN